MDLSIIVAHRDSDSLWRNRCAAWTFARISRLWPDAELVIADSGETVFNHAASFNWGAERARGDIWCFMDSDTFVSEPLMRGATRAVELGVPWAMARWYCQINAEVSTEVVNGERKDTAVERQQECVWVGDSVSWAGFVVCRPDDYMAVRGYDARLSGWAPDDIAFGLTMNALVGPVTRMTGSVWHLWHATTFQDDHGWTDDKHDLKNRYLDAAGDPVGIGHLVGEKPRLARVGVASSTGD